MQPSSLHRVPLLENGDRLTRPEFERRYEAMPNLKKAELIEGTVYMPSPVRVNRHARPHARIVAWLSAYWTATPGTDLCIEPSVRLDLDNEPQPDAVLRIEGGNSWIDQDDYIQGAPELMVEVAASSVSKDLNAKLQAYRRNGIQEYLVWKVEEQEIVWFTLRAGEYIRLHSDDQDVIHSQVFPGLWLHRVALLQNDLSTVLACLQRGLQSSQYLTFKQQLAKLN
jgi:Uma2 family endonuclease